MSKISQRDASILARRAEAFAAPLAAFAGDHAWTAYRVGWSLYHAVRLDAAMQSDIERAYALFTDASALFEARKDDFRQAKALNGLSLVSGLLGRRSQSNETSRRSLELLEHCRVTAEKDKTDRLTIIMKSLRGLAENSATAEECIRSAHRGREFLELLPIRESDPDQYHRYRALFDRALGSAYGRSRPRTIETLRLSEDHFTKAIAFFERITATQTAKDSAKSKGKTYRELSRTRRALAAMLKPTDSDAAFLILKAALQAAEKAVDLYTQAGDDSHWNQYHLAKALRDMGRTSEALSACMKGVRLLESGRQEYAEEGHRIEWMSEKLVVYDLAIYLAHELGQSDLGFELSQSCKARSFLEKLLGRQAEGKPVLGGPGKTASDLAKQLGDGEALIEYHLGRHGLSIFLLTSKGLTTARIICDRASVEARVEDFLSLMRQVPTENTEFYLSATLRDLAQVLLLPVLGALESICRLYIVPSGLLSYLPFSALPLPTGGLAIEKWELVDLPSAALLPPRAALTPKVSARKLLVLANPTLDLWNAEDEAAEVARTFPEANVVVGEKATKQLLADIKGTTHLHIACHGQYAVGDARGSRLILAADAHDDGVLGVGEIGALPLGGVDLAFLSCCKSAHGRYRAGDEFEGVHRAFLTAGARSVVATLWDIEDAVTRQLVVSFYKHLNEGQPKSSALRRAMLEVLAKHSHPYYWAGFKLIGAA
ncbi:MAG: hypothetical protein A2V88_04820 [Elusimicrobia bacterium RBG_16_66_12]|nr:MAG: hypothetical protein A2V88_04820 [Elusimicrobia bacterium RBG_16_66_12]